MTTAICFNCGAPKFGAWERCQSCGEKPVLQREGKLSLALSEYFMDADQRLSWSVKIENGEIAGLEELADQFFPKGLPAFDEVANINQALLEAAQADEGSNLSQRLLEAEKADQQEDILEMVVRLIEETDPPKIEHATAQSLSNSSIKNSEVSIDGTRFLPWVSKATPANLALLNKAEYSDSDNIYVVIDADQHGICISLKDEHKPIRKHWDFFKDGTFFLEGRAGTEITQLIEGSLSARDRQANFARTVLNKFNIPARELDDGTVINIAELLRRWDRAREVPEGSDWNLIYDVAKAGSKESRRAWIKLLTAWIENAEKMQGKADVYRRTSIAYLFRDGGDLDKALEASGIVEHPYPKLTDNGKSLAVLCTIRAATFMDLFECRRESELLRDARLTLNKARACGGASSEVSMAFKRLDKLERDDRSDSNKRAEHENWEQLRKLPCSDE